MKKSIKYMSNKDKYYQNLKLQQLDIENILIDGINKRIEILELFDSSDYNVPNPRVKYEFEKQKEENRLRIEKEEQERINEIRKQNEERERVYWLQIEEDQKRLEEEMNKIIYEDNEERDKYRDKIRTSSDLGFQSSLFLIVGRTERRMNSIINREKSYKSQLKLVEMGRNYLGKAKLIDQYYTKHFFDSDFRSKNDTSSISVIREGFSSLKLEERQIVKDSDRIIYLDEEDIAKYSEKIFKLENNLL